MRGYDLRVLGNLYVEVRSNFPFFALSGAVVALFQLLNYFYGLQTENKSPWVVNVFAGFLPADFLAFLIVVTGFFSSVAVLVDEKGASFWRRWALECEFRCRQIIAVLICFLFGYGVLAALYSLLFSQYQGLALLLAVVFFGLCCVLIYFLVASLALSNGDFNGKGLASVMLVTTAALAAYLVLYA